MNRDDPYKAVRKEYRSGQLLEDLVSHDPFEQFKAWFDAVMASDVVEPNACALATTGPDARPSLRMVLLKGIDSRGMIFFTNYSSIKGLQIESNPHAALLFYWAQFERQVRIEGTVERLEDVSSDTYFSSRPRDAQVGAIVSKQSRPVESRKVLDEAVERFVASHPNGTLGRPSNWGGYRVVPHSFEFWQGRESRLHDRLRYVKENEGWKIERLWP
jgi:pyridoxamine 5'-phosphate oxidase